jgi:hypothetical protein
MQGEMVRVHLPLETRDSLPVLNICPLFTILVGMKGKEGNAWFRDELTFSV